MMDNRDKFPAVFFFFLSLYICYESVHLGVGTLRKPGSGFFPFWSGVAIGILTLVILFQSWKLKADEEESAQGSWREKLFCFVSLLAFALLLKTLGFLFTTFLFIGFFLKVVERKGWVTATLTALAVAFASYGLFEICLQSQLPTGIFGI
jgi:putative tricarboxylic transport membrane protein